MKERPILFSGAMVAAILAGRKTQTRRVVKPQPTDAMWDNARANLGGDTFRARPAVGIGGIGLTIERDGMNPIGFVEPNIHCPYGRPGKDRLWVRERARVIAKARCRSFANGEGEEQRIRLRYEADGAESDWISYPERLAAVEVGECIPNGCFREAARTFLEITGVRVERLNDISENDATAEGVTLGAFSGGDNRDAIRAFHALWENIHGTGSWAANPWTWAITFKRVENTNA